MQTISIHAQRRDLSLTRERVAELLVDLGVPVEDWRALAWTAQKDDETAVAVLRACGVEDAATWSDAEYRQAVACAVVLETMEPGSVPQFAKVHSDG